MEQQDTDNPAVLAIAGFDPSGGAGVITDTCTFAALACRPTAAITSITFQNDSGVWGAEHTSIATLRAQVSALTREHSITGAKTGMLPTTAIVSEVANLFRETNLPPPVVDPVMHSSSGYSLMEEGALATLIKELLPLARLITPNIPEAERITGLRINTEKDMRRAAAAIRVLGARAVLVKGGHLERQEADGGSQTVGRRRQTAGEPAFTHEAIDVLDDEGTVTIFRGAWIDVGNVRGTGCMLSAAIAACIARRMSLELAVAEAKRFISQRISQLTSNEY